jgi:hypothetical protein
MATKEFKKFQIEKDKPFFVEKKKMITFQSNFALKSA